MLSSFTYYCHLLSLVQLKLYTINVRIHTRFWFQFELKTMQQERSKYTTSSNKNKHYEFFETLSIQPAKNADQKANELENIEIKEIFHPKIRL